MTSTAPPIAIIGIGCRFPGGADSPSAFWDLLCDGAEGAGIVVLKPFSAALRDGDRKE